MSLFIQEYLNTPCPFREDGFLIGFSLKTVVFPVTQVWVFTTLFYKMKPKKYKMKNIMVVFPAFNLITHFKVNATPSESTVGIPSQKVWIAIAVWTEAICEKGLDTLRQTSPRIQHLDLNKENIEQTMTQHTVYLKETK